MVFIVSYQYSVVRIQPFEVQKYYFFLNYANKSAENGVFCAK